MKDVGHDLLIKDLESLLREAKEFQFHDFKNLKYPTPKVALTIKLRDLAEQCKSGRYDNG